MLLRHSLCTYLFSNNGFLLSSLRILQLYCAEKELKYIDDGPRSLVTSTPKLRRKKINISVCEPSTAVMEEHEAAFVANSYPS